MTILGHSVKTTIIGYVIAALVAIQPLLTDVIDWDSKAVVTRYIFRLLVAVAVAVFGKMAADSSQVKEVKQETAEVKKVAAYNSMLIDEHLSDQDQVNRDQQEINRGIPPNEYNTRE